MTQTDNKITQEDEIDLRELFKTLAKKKKFIAIFTGIITFGAIIYSLLITPTYEVKAVLEIGSYSNSNSNSNSIENPQNLIKRLEISHIDNASKEDEAILQTVALVKNTTNLIELNVYSSSNEKALEKINAVTNEVIQDHKVKLNNYISSIESKLKNLTNQKQQYEENGAKEVKVSVENFPTFSRYGTTMLDITNQIEDLKFSISKHNLIETHIVGTIILNKHPIKPKKTLIVSVAFVTAFILAIFIVFFMEFLKGIKDE